MSGPILSLDDLELTTEAIDGITEATEEACAFVLVLATVPGLTVRDDCGDLAQPVDRIRWVRDQFNLPDILAD